MPKLYALPLYALLSFTFLPSSAQTGYRAFPTGATCYPTQVAACNAWIGWTNPSTGATIVESIPNGAYLYCMVRYSNEPPGYPTSTAALGYCSLPQCPVPPLSPITDPASLEHENGVFSRSPDMDRLNTATQQGAACIVNQTLALGQRATITSGFRPSPYQRHLREVWDKWMLLRNNSSEACQSTKESVRVEWERHRIVRQPGNTSNHSQGNAVDIAGVPSATADAIALACNMQRPLADDPVHYEPR